MGFLKQVSEVKANKDWRQIEYKVRLDLYVDGNPKHEKAKAAFEKDLAELINKHNAKGKGDEDLRASSFPVLKGVK